MTINSDRIGIIGAGLGGLAAACTLAARGHQVTLFERNPWLGGKAAILNEQGYQFDMGPTILIMPSVLRRIFQEAGRDLEQYLELIPLDPQWRCFFADGSKIDLQRDPNVMARNLAAFAPGKKLDKGYLRFMQLSERLRRISDNYFLWRSVGSVKDTLNVKNTFSMSVLADLAAMRFGRSVAQTVREHIKDTRAAQLVDHFTQYVGSAPDASPAVLCGIAHMQTGEGVWYPRGGTAAVPQALRKLGEELGVEFRTGVQVQRILTENGTVRGIETDQGEVPLAAVVANSDAVRTYRELIGNHEKDVEGYRTREFEPACSGVVLYLGLKRRYDHLLHHNFVFSTDPEAEFDAIYREGKPAPDPTCYLCAPAVSDPSVAPPGGESLYVLVHTPYLRPGHDWTQMLPEYRQVIFRKLAQVAGLNDLEDNIAFEAALTPQDIHNRYQVLQGAIYGLASHGCWTGAFKPANRSTEIKGLYLGGGAAHPGPGMPMALMSGWIAADCLDSDHVTLGQASDIQAEAAL